MSETPPIFLYRLITAARVLVGWSQEELSERAGVARSTVARINKQKYGVRALSYKAIKKTLEDEGIIFLEDGVRLVVDRESKEH